MLDIIITTPAANLLLVPDCIRSIEEHTDAPMTIKVMVDGGTERAVDPIRATMSAVPKHIEWRIIHERTPVGQLALLNRAIKTPKHPMSVVVPAQVRLDDKKWVSKVRQLFDRDPGLALVDMAPNAQSSAAAPVRRTRKLPPLDGTFFVVKTRFAATKELMLREESAMKQWFEHAFATGHSCWYHPGVRFHVADHEEHKPCASQSQTTPR
jgi:hypothetical protein